MPHGDGLILHKFNNEEGFWEGLRVLRVLLLLGLLLVLFNGVENADDGDLVGENKRASCKLPFI